MSQPAEVTVEAAYEAAVDRAVKTTSALILAEAQVLTLVRRVQQLEAENGDLRRRLPDASAPDEGEVMHDAASEAAGADAGGAAHTAHPFSD